jgi:hypothetical protein
MVRFQPRSQPLRTDSASLEKGRLGPGLSLVLKVAQADTHQAIAFFRTKIHAFPQLHSDLCQFFRGRWWSTRSVAASQDLELAGLQLENYRPR